MKNVGSYDFGEIDWDEFWQVVKGHGPCNKERMKAELVHGKKANGCEMRRWLMRKKTRKKTKTSSLKQAV